MSAYQPREINMRAALTSLGVVLVAGVLGLPLLGQSPSLDRLAWLTDRVSAATAGFYLFKDQDSGENHAFAAGVIGDSEQTRSRLVINAGCVFDGSAPNGCSSSSTQTDPDRGTVLRLGFPALNSSQWVGLIFVEPERYLISLSGRGYDLRGAARISFDIWSSDPNLRVKFAVNGSETEFRAYGRAWKRETIQLNMLSQVPSLSSVNSLFTIVTDFINAQSGGSILLDNVRFEPDPQITASELRFPSTVATVGVTPVLAARSGRLPIPVDQLMRGQAMTSDLALAAIALLRGGSDSHLASARYLLRGLDYVLRHPNRALALPSSSSTGSGLAKCYSSGAIGMYNDFPGGAQAGDARLCGYTLGDRYVVTNDGASTFANALAILAYLRGFDRWADNQLLEDARTVTRWMNANLRDTSSTGFGGFYRGYRDGSRELWREKLTADNAAAAAAMFAMAAVEARLGNTSAASSALEGARSGASYVLEMAAPGGRYYVGTVLADQPRVPGLQPDGPRKGNDLINTFVSAEPAIMAVLALASRPEYVGRQNWAETATWLQGRVRQQRAMGNVIVGFAPSEESIAGPNGISSELTALGALAMNAIAAVAPRPTLGDTAENLVNSVGRISTPQGGVPSVVLDEVTPEPDQCLNVLGAQCLPQRGTFGATALAFLATMNASPFAPMPRAVRAVSGASFGAEPNGEAVAPLSIASLFGEDLAPTATQAELVENRLPVQLGGTSVTVDGVCAPLYYVSPQQINFQVPSVSRSGSLTVKVIRGASSRSCSQAGLEDSLAVTVRSVAPAVFTVDSGVGRVIAVDAISNMLVTAAAPARIGRYYTVYGTGLGPVNPPVEAGSLVTTASRITGRPVVSIGGIEVPGPELQYVGLTPQSTGLYQVNFRLPPVAASGLLSFRIVVDGASSQDGVVLPVAVE